MRYRTLGRTEFSVSEVSHGLWGMSNWTGSDEQQSLSALQCAVDLGCNFLDSAWAYGNGKSDRFAGQILHANQGKHIYFASKVPPKNRLWPAQGSLQDAFPADHVFEYVEKIRASAGVDTIDLLQYHVWEWH